jgi:histidine triad (HIT) family protein
MGTIFSKIISGELPCYKVAEDKNYLAFLDIQPLVRGHVLVIPKIEKDYIFDLEDDVLSGLFIFSKNVARMMKGKFDCNRIGISVIGLEVPHAHVHLLPINNVSDMDFSKEKLKLSHDEFEEIISLILK